MYYRLMAFLLLLVAVLNFSYDFRVEAQPIEITINTCLGRSQLDSAGQWKPLPDNGECYFNSFNEINQWYANEFANGREVYKKKARIQKINEVQQAEKERGCKREPLCIITKSTCPTPPDWMSEQDQEACCSRCFRLSILSEKGCVPNPNGCPDPDIPPVVPIVEWGLSGEWKGVCGGRGKFSPPVLPPINAWPSQTGCYIPEERFVIDVPVISSPLTPLPRPTIKIPDDWVLTLHPTCATKFAMAGVSGSGFLSFNDKNSSTGRASEIICLGDDYSDDVDNFCVDFVKTGTYEKDRLVYKSECTGSPTTSGWEIEKISAIVSPTPPSLLIPEHYMPLAIELSSTNATTPNFNTTGTAHSMQRYDLGDYGYNDRRVARGDPTNAGVTVPGTSMPQAYEFNKRNIYNQQWIVAATPPATGTTIVYEAPDDEILNMNNRGVRAKRMDCLKIYIEQWAHRGDCGEIVLKGAQSGYSEGHCQWVAMYRADTAAMTFSPTGLASALSTPTPRGMRSEFYDYENLNRTGWLKVVPDGVLLENTDICTFGVSNGGQDRFWTPSDGVNRGTLDFAQRGCPTVSGPDIFPNMNCSTRDGADRIDNPANFAAGALMTTDIEDIRSLNWEIHTGGIDMPLVVYRAMIDSTVELDDWVDGTHPARSCTTFTVMKDSYFETPDCKDLTCLGEHDGFLYKKGKKVYQWETNLPTLTNGSLWCEFEVPFNPYTSDGPSFIPFTEHIRGNSAVRDSYSPFGLGEPLLQLRFPMVERIRTSCGAFNQRATWDEDQNRVLTRFMIGKDIGRCDEWTGYFKKEYEKVSTVSWRLPRFDYEFLKAFLQCTGPVIDAWKACDSKDNGRILYNALPVQYGGCGCFWMFDDKTEPNNWYSEFDETEAFGFWCKCKSDDFLTVECNEAFCTCQQSVLLSHGVLTVCEDYGPFKRWLKCFYQARAKSCSVLTRDISNGIAGSLYMLEEPCNPTEEEDSCESQRIVDFDGNDPVTNVADAEVVASNYDDMCDGSAIPLRAGSLRWQAQEANILARLPVRSDGGAYDVDTAGTVTGVFKHHDLMYMAQTRDIYPPFMEPTIPWPLEVPANCPAHPSCLGINAGTLPPYDATDRTGVDPAILNYSSEYVAAVINAYLKGLADVSDAFANTDLGTPLQPSLRAQEAIVGPRGCDIGGWYEMMLYQGRCIKWFKLNCICDYSKTFALGSAESYVLLKGGTKFETRRPYVVDGGDGFIDVIPVPTTSDDKLGKPLSADLYWPLMSRGQAGPYYAPLARPGSKLWDKKNIGQDGAASDGSNPARDPDINWVDDGTRDTNQYRGLDEAERGDFMILDETIKSRRWVSEEHTDYDAADTANYPVDDRFDARYRRHIAYVESVTSHENDISGDVVIKVSEYNYGKNMDSCGNTDRWSKVTYRYLHKSDSHPNVVDAAFNTKFCSNPDWVHCYEPNWERIKLYRPNLDVVRMFDNSGAGPFPPNQEDLPRPVCYNKNWDGSVFVGGTNPNPLVAANTQLTVTPDYQPFFPQKITNLGLDSRMDISGVLDPVPDKTALLGMSPQMAIATGAWKRQALGYYDDTEVRLFLDNKVGRCDPPL